MSDLRDQLEAEVKRIIDEPMPEPSESIRLESEGVFDSAGYPLPIESIMGEEFFDNPMGPIMKMLGQYLDSIRPKTFEPPKSEHEVRIFQLNESIGLAAIDSIERTIEGLLNDGYCCHMPTVVGSYVIMDFSRRKETEKDEREQ